MVSSVSVGGWTVPSRAGTPPTLTSTPTTPTVRLSLPQQKRRFLNQKSKCDLDKFVALQSPLSCGGRCAVTQTQCGVWCTAPLTTASFPARLTGRSGCGAPPTPRHLLLFLTSEEVRKPRALTLRSSSCFSSLLLLFFAFH